MVSGEFGNNGKDVGGRDDCRKETGRTIFDGEGRVRCLHGYPLSVATALEYDGDQWRLGPFAAAGKTEEDALDAIGAQLDGEFQRCWTRPLHEFTKPEYERWQQICEFIDIKEYRRNNPIEEAVIGRVVSTGRKTVTLELLTGQGKITRARGEVPDAIAAMKAGDYFTARVRMFGSGEIDWRSVESRPPLREDPGVWGDFDAVCRSCPGAQGPG
ncbi:MAG: hypothetical protein PHY92_03295 [Alphaproteobacteria bacterium]|nr:hypothetical protein [Alphaproteobacteria bacterium]